MTDIAIPYTLTSSGGTITFNNGEVPGVEDVYYLTDIRGLSFPTLRTPLDDAPQADGGLDHDFFAGALHPVFEGEYVVQSTTIGNEIQVIRAEMHSALRAVLRAMLRVADAGTLSFTDLSEGSKSLTVRTEVPLEDTGVEQRMFSFGLYSSSPDPE